MTNYQPTHSCGALRESDVGQRVRLSGWVHRRRDHGGLIFIDLRDRYGLTQIVCDPEKSALVHQTAERLRAEWVISVAGTIALRQEGMENSKLATGLIELEAEHLEILSPAKTPPFSICDEEIEVNEELRLKYRYLDIRRGKVAKNLALRHQVMLKVRNYLDQKQFLEIHTPILGRSTPEGARDYLVPSRIYPGSFYALPQSPQIFKQLLMVAGMDRYFQIAPCFRDEDLRADRQPEFSQIDLEMSFACPDTLFSLVEGLMQQLFPVSTPFLRLSYAECIDRFGTDKPDLRFAMELKEISDLALKSSFTILHEELSAGGIVKAFVVKGGSDLSRKAIDDYILFAQRLGMKGLAWIKLQSEGLASSIAKFFDRALQQELIDRLKMEQGDLVFISAGYPKLVNQTLDHLRRKVAHDRQLISSSFAFLWVTDFPLFTYNDEKKEMESEHHPFTAPHFADLPLLESDPLKVRSSSYDLVLNGYEIASGSQRIHHPEMQAKIFQLLRLSEKEIEEKFGFFVEALSFGTPPHLGIALGLDRLLMILAQTEQIRDVIAFPKTQKASDLMMACPAAVSANQLDELEIALKR